MVTGQGVVTPVGIGVDRFWAALKNSECGIRAVRGFSTEDLYIPIAVDVPDFDPPQRQLRRALMLAVRYSHLARPAAQ